MSLNLLLAVLSFRGSVEAVGPRGFLARIESMSLWTVDFSDSSFLTARADFWKFKILSLICSVHVSAKTFEKPFKELSREFH